MRRRLVFSRVLLAVALAVASATVTEIDSSTGIARAAAVENLMVPSAAMGRDIPVSFIAGGPHAVYLLDPFDAGPDVSGWVTAGNAMNTLAGKGISVAAPAGGAYSMYTDWEQDGSKRWETFLSSELPDWLAANKGLAPGGHAVVGAGQGGYAAMALAAFHPDRFGYAGSMSGFLYPPARTTTARSWPACSSSAGLTATVCGERRNWAGGSGTTRTCTPRCSRKTTPAFGSTPRNPVPAILRPCWVTPTRRQDQTWSFTSSTAPSAGTMATSTSRSVVTTAGARGRASWAPCPATSLRLSASVPSHWNQMPDTTLYDHVKDDEYAATMTFPG